MRKNEVVSFLEKHINTDVESSKLQPQSGLYTRVSIALKHDVAT